MPARVVLDRLSVPIFAVHDDTVLYANRAFELMMGHPDGSLNGCRGTELVDGDDSVEHGSSFLRTGADGLSHLRHADGGCLKVILNSLMDLVHGDGLITLVSVQDVSEQLWESASRRRAIA
jgi:hypothetical protein